MSITPSTFRKKPVTVQARAWPYPTAAILARTEGSSPSGPDSTPRATDETRQVVDEPVGETITVAVTDPCDNPLQVQHGKRGDKNGDPGQGLNEDNIHIPKTDSHPATNSEDR